MHRLLRVLAAAAVLGGAGALAGCASPAHPSATVVVRVAPSAEPVEVRLTEAHGDYRAVHRMQAGESRRFAVPAGWLTVRVPGLCVVPAPGRGTAVVEVDRHACRLV